MASPRTIRLLKAFLLGLVVLTLLVVGALYTIGKKAQFTPPTRSPDAVDTDPGTQQQGSGFDHTVSRDGEPLFRMRGGRDRRDQDGNLFVEDVLVTVFRPNGERLEVVADQARYNLERESAELQGNVTIAGDDGLALTTEKLLLQQGGRILESTGDVEFRYGQNGAITGMAGKLRADLEREVFIFQSGVTMSGSQDYQLKANRVLIERGERLIRATGEVRVRWQDSVLNADQVAATLASHQDRLRFLRAHWNVSVRLHTGLADQARVTRLRGSRLGILFDGPEGEVSRIEIEDEVRGRARIESASAMGTSVLWKTRFFKGDFVRGNLNSVLAEGRAELTEYLTADPSFLIRRICSARSNARFGPNGEMQQINALREVDIQNRQVQMLADSTRVTPESLEVEGMPVLVVGGLGKIEAPKVNYSESNGLVHATGGVEVELPPDLSNPLAAGPLSGGQEPVRVTSDEGFIRPSTSSFMFQGNVRAWSGPRLLRSHTLRGDAEPQRLTAGGGVENVWSVVRTSTNRDERSQVRVRADGLIYEPEASLATYRGSVEVVDGPRTLTCSELAVRLDEQGEVQSLDCEGSVELNAPEEGRRVRADRAEYDVGEGEVVFRGNPAKLFEQSGASLQGATVVYSVQGGTVQIRGRDPNATAEQNP